MALSTKQKAFINHYLATFNATEAARRAKYKGDDATLASVGWENLRKPEIEQAIKERLSAQAMTADEVLMRLAAMGRADIGPWMSIDGTLDLEKLKDDGATHLIKKLKRTERSGISKDGGEWSVATVEVELYDAQAAVVQIGKHHKLFTESVEHKGSVELIHKGYVGISPDEWDER